MPRSKTEWKKSRRHADVTLPSGTQVDIELPNLLELLKAGDIPNKLVPLVLKTQKSDEEIDLDKAKDGADLQRYLVVKTVVDPKVTEDEVADLPAEDVAMIGELALRQRDMDAAGKHIAGLDKLESFRKFRGLDGSALGLGL